MDIGTYQDRKTHVDAQQNRKISSIFNQSNIAQRDSFEQSNSFGQSNEQFVFYSARASPERVGKMEKFTIEKDQNKFDKACTLHKKKTATSGN